MDLSGFFELRQVSKHYGSLRAVDRVSVSIGKGEVFSILGPSGCGKTTLLKVAAGFEAPDHGSVLLEGEDLTSLPPNRRPINTIFQNYALFPHLSLRDNIAFGPRAAGWPKDRIASQVEMMLEMIDMKAHAGKKPSQVSGGQKQRVAIARALINQPKVLLLDEPLAALDLKLRQRMILELDRIHREVGTTFIFVTHDQGEAMSLSDRVAVMNRGRIEQIGTPAQIYESPQSRFVASFIGDTHFLDGGKIEQLLSEGYCRVLFPNRPPVDCHNPLGKAVGQAVTLSLRPEKLRILPQPPPPAALQNVMKGKIEDIIYAGAETLYFVRSGDCRLRVPRRNNHHAAEEGPLQGGEEVWVSWHGKDGCLLPTQENEDAPPE